MLCYVKDGKTFGTKCAAHAEYDITVSSIYDESSVITLHGAEAAVGDMVFAEGYCGVVREAERRGERVSLTCDDAVSLLERKLFLAKRRPPESVEQFIVRQIEENFTAIKDPAYRLDFLQPSALTHTAAELQPVEEGGLWSVKDYVRRARALLGIYTDFCVAGERLLLRVARRDSAEQKIDLSLSQYETVEQCVSAEQTAKITAYAQDTGAFSDWYMLENGEITAAQPAEGRAQGRWESLVVARAGQVEAAVQERFAQNSAAHLVEFATLHKLGFGDGCLLRLEDGRIMRSYISALRKKSGDARTFYKAGELRPLIGQALRNRLGG